MADICGYCLAGTPTVAGAFQSVPPARVLDTRTGLGAPKAFVPAGSSVAVQIDGKGGIPSTGVAAVVVNVTVTAPTAAGYITAYSDGSALPTASNLIFTARQTIPNLFVVPVWADGKIRL